MANVLVAGATVLFRAGAQAYRQAIISELHLLAGQPATRATRCHQQNLLTEEPLGLQVLTGPRPGANRGWSADGAKAGVGGAEAAAGAASRATGQITLQEAKQILGIERDVTMEEVLKVS